MVHKVEKHPTEEMDEWVDDLDRQQDEYLKSLEDDMKRQEEQYAKDLKEMEAFAVGTYKFVTEIPVKVKKGVEVVKKKVAEAEAKAREIELGAKEVWERVRPRPRVRWYEREPIIVSLPEKVAKKREAEEKKYVRIEV